MTSGSGALNEKALSLFEQALEQEQGTRTAWIISQAGKDIALRDKALSYLSRDKMTQGAFHTGGAFHETLDDTVIPERIGAYKITGLIGRGGMGAVYRGERASGDFDHDVAIKVVRAGAMSDKLVARFEAERQTLASLSHPNIARLFDGGTLESGAPYIVMEFIDGLPITEFANKHALTEQERLELFKAVCGAVSHAHQNLIIHRDITPSNVLVDKEGQVKLIDFGIAKPFDEDAAVLDMENSLASLSFTPGFAAPERSKGAGANTLSDVYSLGKLLNILMNNFEKNADLKAIISKATALTPGERYSSVDAFIDDLGHYADGFPVAAYPNTGIYKVKKFISRHKLSSILGSAALLSLITAFGITSYQYQQAQFARAQANKRFSETRELTKYLLNDLAEDLQVLPGTLEIQQDLRKTTTKYLDILAKAANDDETLLLEYAVAERHMGELLTQAGGANLGDPKQAYEHFDISINILTKLKNGQNANEDVFFALAKAQFNYGYTLGYHENKNADGLPYINRSITNYSKAVELNQGMEGAWLNRAQSKLIAFYAAEGNWEQSTAELDAIKNEYETIIAKFPDSEWGRPYMVTFLRNSANYKLDHWNQEGDDNVPPQDKSSYLAALTDIKTSKDIAQDLIKENPSNPEHKYQYIWSQEIETLLYALNRGWQMSFENAVQHSAETRKAKGLASASDALQNHPEFEWRQQAAAYLIPGIDISDEYLNQLRPFDGKSYSYAEAVFYNYTARGVVEAQLHFDFDASINNLGNAMATAKKTWETHPKLENDALEFFNTQMLIAEILIARQVFDDRYYQGEICTALKQAKSLLTNFKAEFGQTPDYQSNYSYYEELIIDQSCRSF